MWSNFAIHATRKGGVISLIGAYGPPSLGVDIGTFMNKAQTMRTGQASVKRYMPHLLEHVRAGRIQQRQHRRQLGDLWPRPEQRDDLHRVSRAARPRT